MHLIASFHQSLFVIIKFISCIKGYCFLYMQTNGCHFIIGFTHERTHTFVQWCVLNMGRPVCAQLSVTPHAKSRFGCGREYLRFTLLCRILINICMPFNPSVSLDMNRCDWRGLETFSARCYLHYSTCMAFIQLGTVSRKRCSYFYYPIVGRLLF